MAFALPAIATLSAARGLAQENPALASLNETKSAEVRIVSTEFKYAPAKIRVAAGWFSTTAELKQSTVYSCGLSDFACK
jgi:hypothetical protein